MTIDDIITALENENAKLMNRIFDLEAEKEALISGQETLQKALIKKGADYEALEIAFEVTRDNLGVRIAELNEAKTEVERLREENERFADIGKMYNEVKSKAIIRFAEEFEKRCIASGVYPAVTKNILKNLVKELTEVTDNV